MAAKLPVVRARDLIRALERDGWYIARTTGHHFMQHPTKPGQFSVPNHPSETIRPGTLRSILQSAGLTADDLRRLL